MAKKQANMQRKAETVASLDIEPEVEVIHEPTPKKHKISEEEAYEDAVKYIKRNFKPKQIADRLVVLGLSRPEATRIAQKAWQENRGERRTNANILMGVAVFFIGLALIIFVPDWIYTGVFDLYTPALLPFLVGIWFLYKAIQEYRTLE